MADEEKCVKLFNQVFEEWGDLSFFKWKYKKNPFGDSIVKFQYDGNEVVSARYFMHWKMHDSGSTYDCYQATDSATLKPHRGKGLFKALTLGCLDNLHEDNFVFNFPNDNSYGIYLKLGWKEVAKIRPLIIPTMNAFRGKEVSQHTDLIYTEWTDELLQWRLSNGKKYFVYGDDEQPIFIYRRLTIKGINVADIIYSREDVTESDLKIFCRKLLLERTFAIRYIGLHTKLRTIIENNAKLKFTYGKGVNFVTYNAPKDADFRIEMIDADYI